MMYGAGLIDRARRGVVVAVMPLIALCSGPALPPAGVTAEPLSPEPGVSAPAPDAAVAGGVVINEILAHTDPPQVDWVELYNSGPDAVDISGWFLSDNKDAPRLYQFPPGTVVAANGYTVVPAGVLPFAFSEFGEKVYLSDSTGIMDVVDFGVSPNGVSLGRYVTSTGAVHFPLQQAITEGAPNVGPRVGPVVISEIMYNPKVGSEYVVLTNISDQVQPLYDPQNPQNRWQVSGFGDKGAAYVLPPDVQLGPGASLVVAADPAAFQAARPALGVLVVGPTLGKLDNAGERIALQQPQPPETNGDEAPAGVRCEGTKVVACADVDVVAYGSSAPWPTAPDGQGPALVRVQLNGYGNDPANWRAGAQALRAQSVVLLPVVLRPVN